MGIITFDRHAPDSPKPEADRPGKVISGNPTNITWNFTEHEDGRLVSGMWESEVGKWEASFPEWEFCHIISGEVIVTVGDKATTYRAGDAFVMEPGLVCTWEVTQKLLKHYVILAPKG